MKSTIQMSLGAVKYTHTHTHTHTHPHTHTHTHPQHCASASWEIMLSPRPRMPRCATSTPAVSLKSPSSPPLSPVLHSHTSISVGPLIPHMCLRSFPCPFLPPLPSSAVLKACYAPM